MKPPKLRNFDEYVINEDDVDLPSYHSFIRSIDGHNDKWFVRCDSKYFSDFFDELLFNPNSSYVTYLNDFIKDNYDGMYLPISEVYCFKKTGENNLTEEYVSRLANALHIPTTYIKNVPAITQEEFNQQLLELIQSGLKAEYINLYKENYLLSIDFISKNNHFNSLNDYAHCKVDENLVESDSNIKEWFAGFTHIKLRNPETHEILSDDEKMQLFRQFVPQYFFKQYITRDWDFKSENVGILYNKENKTYTLSPMFDFEFCYMYTHERINYEILEEDLIFAYDAFPTETTRLKQEIEQLDIEEFLDEIITIQDGEESLTTEQLTCRKNILMRFNEFKALMRELEYTKDFVE